MAELFRKEGINPNVYYNWSKEFLMAAKKTGKDGVAVKYLPRLLSDNGPCYISGELREYLDCNGISLKRGARTQPVTQGKIESYHRSMKNEVRLQNYYFPSELESQIERFAEYYNNKCYHESLNNLTPSDIDFGKDKKIIERKQRIKRKTLVLRKQQNLTPVNQHFNKNNLALLNTIS